MLYPSIREYIDALRFAEVNLRELSRLRLVWRDGKPVMRSGHFAVIFRMSDGARDYAVKCFTKYQKGRDEAYRKITAELRHRESEYLVDIEYLEGELCVSSRHEGERLFPVLLMEWVEGITLDVYLRSVSGDRSKLSELADNFGNMARWLLRQPLAHGDLKPDNIIVRPDGSLVLLDYDGMYVPSMSGETAREKGTPPYCYPSGAAGAFGSHIDDHAAVLIELLLRAVAFSPNLDYGELLSKAGTPDFVCQFDGMTSDARIACLLSAYESDVCRHAESGSRLPDTLPLRGNGADRAGASGDAADRRGLDAVHGHGCVDLGLSVLWAECNVGARRPDEYGDCFSWGETAPAPGLEYSERYCGTWDKPCGDVGGDSRHDAAQAIWGGPWRLPTVAEFRELLDNCTWEWTVLNEHYGYRVQSKVNGNAIFLPAAGWRDDASLRSVGSFGLYWSSTPYGYGNRHAYFLFLRNGYRGVIWYWCNRHDGIPVRPVCHSCGSHRKPMAASTYSPRRSSMPEGHLD